MNNFRIWYQEISNSIWYSVFWLLFDTGFGYFMIASGSMTWLLLLFFGAVFYLDISGLMKNWEARQKMTASKED